MKNKILILLMSCGQPLYKQEEQACRDTFLKDAEAQGIPYFFYSGTDAKETSMNQEFHTMLLPVQDNLGSTSLKTIMAFTAALEMDDWDYILKTNVSTWLDIPKIVEAVDKGEGREDRNIYGGRFLANKYSLNAPFPRGNFMILSRSLVTGIVSQSGKMLLSDRMPRTDDTFLCFSMYYYLQKVCGDNYHDHLMEIPSVNTWTQQIQNAPEWTDAISIRCKDETVKENTPDNMRKVHELKRSNEQPDKSYRRPMTIAETRYGVMQYDSYVQVCMLVDVMKKMKEGTKPPQQETQKKSESKT